MIHLPKLNEGKFWNLGPMVVTGCTKVSPGCTNCWSEKNHAMRQSNLDVSHIYSPHLMTDGKFNGKVQFNLHLLEKAVKTRKPQVIAIWNDLYHPGVTDEQLDEVYARMWIAEQHTFLIITKRPERAAEYLETVDWSERIVNKVNEIKGGNFQLSGECKFHDFGNVWHIPTMENQEMVEKRMPHLLNIPGKLGIIIEPVLGPVDLAIPYWQGVGDLLIENVHQVILGGETGHGARPMHPDWVRSIRDQCQAAGVPFYFKSWGEFGKFEDHMCKDYLGPRTKVEIVEGPPVPSGGNSYGMARVGKKRAGRTLDGSEHNALAWVTS